METTALIAEVNRNLGIYGAEFVPDAGSSTPNPTSIHGTINGKPVRLDFTIGNEHPDYDYAVWLHDTRTGQTVGRGNGGSSFREAIQIYQWNGALSDLAAGTEQTTKRTQ